ncbi:ABC transporter substrate-binding protein [Belliella sp. DSM 111904]|uniref:ABC transporter substrate-binding protein n=1 Tax=Belliella filtrata TaxID=2923435 RepID=A0ABS9V264_9BACT|nr:ABC transporter substrate-binding protein [Belliella filtrata]MCH7410295.1 ABC transporter substrate-binding protein [Belliella filtrata]
MKTKFIIVLLFLVACSSPKEQQASTERSIITAGGTISEIVTALGFEDLIIATDITSTFPASLQKLPSIGYRNQIKSEGILSLNPEVILIEKDYLLPEVIAQLQSTGVEVRLFEKPQTTTETISLIAELADFLQVKEEGLALIDKVKADLKTLDEYKSKISLSERPSMLFLMARGEDMVFVAGEETFATSLISLSGLSNPTLGFKDFIPLTPEALVKYNPDYVLMFDSGLASLGGKDGLSKIKGLDQTTAFQKDQILTYDGLLLSGFGPRVGEVALEIAKEVYSK